MKGGASFMFTSRPIGFVSSPYKDASDVPRGLGAKHEAHGVFATRSPRRPNPIGLTIVELLRREGVDLHVRGIDMLDQTPILDIKPLLSSIAAEKLRRGWLAE